MPISGNTFTYTNPTGATGAVAGQVVQSAVWNQIHTDLSNAVNQIYAQVVAGLSLRNFLAANGSFEIWQRGAGSSASIAINASTVGYTADRWYLSAGANQASTVSAQTGLSNPSSLCARVQRNAAQTGTTAMVFAFPFDAPEINRMHGLKLSFTALISTGANWSPTNGTLQAILYYGTGAVAKRNATPYTNEVQGFAISTNFAAGAAATLVSGTTAVVIPTTTQQMELQLTWTPTGTAGANDWFSIDDVQIESIGSSLTWAPTNFDRITPEIELLLSKRHYQKTFDYGTAPAQGAGIAGALGAVAVAAQRIVFFWDYPVDLRVNSGTVTTYNPAGASANAELYSLGVDAGASVAINVQSTLAGTKGVAFYTTTSGGTTNQIAFFHAQVDAGI